MSEACTGCGRCAAACPTHALDAAGFRIGALPARPDDRRPLTVDCWKVPHAAGERDAVRVPCLGGLRTSDLLDLCAAAAPRPVRLLDRGWCAGCSSGGRRHPAMANLEEARALLADVGTALGTLPALEPRPLPDRLMPADIPLPDDAAIVTRRAFARHVLGRSAAIVAKATRPENPSAALPRFDARAVRPRTERSRVLEALAKTVQDAGVALPARLFPVAEATGDCHDQNVCVAQCPTGALSRYEDDRTAGVVFEPGECIECGLCATACPEHAITIRPGARLASPSGTETLTRHRLAMCRHCGARFAPRGEERYCAACEKSREFAATAFQELFAAR